MQIKIIKRHEFRGASFEVGEIHEARPFYLNKQLIFPDSYQIIEGKKSGDVVPKDYCVVMPEGKTYSEEEYNEINQELLQRREEVAELVRQSENREIVEIPRDVATAIEICKAAGLSGFSIVSLMERTSSLFRDYSTSTIKSLEVIRDYAWKVISGGQTLMAALVNGYTVEETEAERDLREARELVEVWRVQPATRSIDESNADLAQRIVDFKRAK